MVERDLAGRGITDPRVLDAMATVPRERFVPEGLRGVAYADRALPIAAGQTISQPYVVALMAQAAEVRPTDRVLEVGTGSGYGAAVLGALAEEVWTVERHPSLAERAATVLEELGVRTVRVVVGDGTLGWPDAAPYDAVVVTADAPTVPSGLADQLADGGRLVIPVGPRDGVQHLRRFRRGPSGLQDEDLGAVRFVPLVGVEGFGDGGGEAGTGSA
jgi:protein-L-isoaspartate(D-aspartate) O-methyltransferase